MMRPANPFAPTVDLNDVIHPEIQVPLAISAIHLEHLYQQEKLSAPGDEHR